MNQLHKIVFLTILLLVVKINAKTYQYNDYWTETKIKSKEADFSLYTKNSPLNYLQNTATATISNHNKESKAQVYKLFKNSIGTKNWATQTIDGIDFYETYDSQSTTLFRFAYNPKNKQYSFGTVKLRYLIPNYLELHALQIEKLTGLKNQKTAMQIYNLLIPKLYAADIGQSIKNGATEAIGLGIQTGLVDTNAAILEAGKNVKTGGADIRAAGQDIRATGKDIKGLATPENVAKLAAVAAITNTVATALTTIVMNGTWNMAINLYHEINGTFTEQEIKDKADNFRESLETFKTLSPKMELLEQKLTILALAINQKTNGNTESLLAKIDSAIELNENKLTEAVIADCQECQSNLQKQFKDLKSIKESVHSKKENLQLYCSVLDTLFNNWVKSEQTLAKARIDIITNAQVFMGTNSKYASAARKIDMQENRKQQNACLGNSENELKNISDKVKKSCSVITIANEVICQKIEVLNRNVNSCKIAEQAKVAEEDFVEIENTTSQLNSSIAQLSKELSSINCSERNTNGSCLKPGPYKEIKSNLNQKLSEIGQQCPTKSFSKIIQSDTIKKSAFEIFADNKLAGQ